MQLYTVYVYSIYNIVYMCRGGALAATRSQILQRQSDTVLYKEPPTTHTRTLPNKRTENGDLLQKNPISTRITHCRSDIVYYSVLHATSILSKQYWRSTTPTNPHQATPLENCAGSSMGSKKNSVRVDAHN